MPSKMVGVKRTIIEPSPGEEVVVSGMAGFFPNAENIDELRESLENGRDLVSPNPRWNPDLFDVPINIGRVTADLSRFDANFFGVHHKQANTMDPQGRVLLEKAYEAIIDAGVNPVTLRESKTAVYVGVCYSETEKLWLYDNIQYDGCGLTGCSRAMLANRISYCLNLTGPSYTLDSACSSSGYALEHAYKAILSGEVDGAIVAAANLLLNPNSMLQFKYLGVLSPTGHCKPFSCDADGYTRAETICALYLTRASNANRIYAQVVHAKTNCDGFKAQSITFPSSVLQQRLFEEFYSEINFPPEKVDYIEAHGTGTIVGDPEEVTAIANVFCKNRHDPLPCGSVKSNLGHSEPASGCNSYVKCCFAMYTEVLPPTIFVREVRKDCPPLLDGRMKVVTETQPFTGQYIAVNTFGFGGANAHALLKKYPNRRKVNGGKPNDDIPRLVCISGRTKEAVTHMVEMLQSRPVDVDYIALFHNIYKHDVSGHVYRGYAVLQSENSENQKKVSEVEHFKDYKRPIWFLFSGMGSQWPGMGKSLLKIQIIAESIARCAKVLQPFGVDLYKIILNESPTAFDDITNAFVGNAAIQIALVDLLTAIGIRPDYIIGHSVGELACAYADGCFTAEEMILGAYCRGLASTEVETIPGLMAAVGLGYEKVKPLLPPEIDVACRNSSTSCTLSGPAAIVEQFVKELTQKDVFARTVNTANIAYHSRYIAEAGPKLLNYIKKNAPEPRLRSSKWISTSVPESEWHTDLAKYSSAEYHTNNLLNPVLFEEGSRHIHEDAIVIEIAPHGLLQAIVKRSLGPNVTNVPLTQRGQDNAMLIMAALGKLYNEGVTADISLLYPKVDFPVSMGTPTISPHIRWEHSQEYHLFVHESNKQIDSGEREVDYSIKKDEYSYVDGHVIDDRNLVPATGYLHLIWESLCLMRNAKPNSLPIVFENVKFLRATTVNNVQKDGIKFKIMIQIGSGNFEIMESGSTVVSGRAYIPEDELVISDTQPLTLDGGNITLKTKDLYKELRLRGYQYKGLFRSIKECNLNGTHCKIAWHDNWVAYMDCMLQTKILSGMGLSRALYIPTEIQKIVIDPTRHLRGVEAAVDNVLNCHFDKYMDSICSEGIEIMGLAATPISRRRNMSEAVLETYEFVPYDVKEKLSMVDALRVCSQILQENSPHLKVKIVENIRENTNANELISPQLQNVFAELPLIQTETILISPVPIENIPDGISVENKKLSEESNASIVIDSNLLTTNVASLKEAASILRNEGLILSRETSSNVPLKEGFHIIEKIPIEKGVIVLISVAKTGQTQTIINVSNNSLETFKWLSTVKILLRESKSAILYAANEPTNGLIGLVNCLRKEPGGEKIRCALVLDKKAPKFDVNNPMYREQLAKNLAINVFKNGQWGSFRHLKFLPTENSIQPHAYANLKTRGDLSTLSWFAGPLKESVPELVEIYFAALNFRDIMVATGKISSDIVSKAKFDPDCDQGLEFAGRDKHGKRVMGMVSAGALGTRIQPDPDFLWDIPDNWTFEDAVTVPVVYSTAYFALVIVGEMTKGTTVLIHAGTGGVGQAAINLALHYGATVYTTVGTEEKREFIKRTFPQITDEFIGNSRDTSFEKMIRTCTKGRGVDLVLNSLAEEKLLASLRCLAEGGKFLEIGKFDLSRNSSMGMQIFLKRTSFHGIMLDKFFEGEHPLKKTLTKGFSKLIKDGAIKPLTRTVFAHDQLEMAYRYMAAGKHMGKVLIDLRKEEGLKVTSSRTANIPSTPRFYCDPEKSYIILGGLGGFGMELTTWLIARGAKKIIIASRKGISNGYQGLKMKQWLDAGVDVKISTAKISTYEGIMSMIHNATLLGPVDGIFNLAVLLRDALLENQSDETFRESLGCKALATKYLDEITRKLCPELKYFVIFSSVSCGRGNIGQSNYGMANSIMERTCEERKAQGFPALAIQWGAVGDVGLVADMQDNDKILEIGGTLQQRITSCLDVLDMFLCNDKPAVVSSMVVAEKKGGMSGTVVECVADIMSIKDIKSISLQSTLSELGMDSMMAVEIQQTLEREFDVVLTAKDIRTLTFARLFEIAKDKTSVVKTANGPKSEKLDEFWSMVRALPVSEVIQQVLVELPSAAVETANNNRPIFFIPGLDGFCAPFTNICKGLSHKCLGLQLIPTSTHDTILEIAQGLLPAIKSNIKPNERFQFVAHSYGCLVAIELAHLLEKDGYNGRIVSIDGSPTLIKALVHKTSAYTSDMGVVVVQGIYASHTTDNVQEFTKELLQAKTWEEQKLVLKRNYKYNIYSDEVFHASMDALLKRYVSVVNYTCEKSRLAATTVQLIRPTTVTLAGASEDYDLGEVLANGTVPVTHLDGNHFTVLENAELVEIIQHHFEEQ